MRIDLLIKRISRAIPFLDLFFARDRGLDIVVRFEIYQLCTWYLRVNLRRMIYVHRFDQVAGDTR